MKLSILDLFIHFLWLLFVFFFDKKEDLKALVLLSKILFKRCGPRDVIANLVIFKQNLVYLKLYILLFVN